MKNLKQRTIITGFIMTAAIIILAVVVLLLYNTAVMDQLKGISHNNINNYVENQIEKFELMLDDKYESLGIIAINLKTRNLEDAIYNTQFLAELSKNTSFVSIGYANLNGNAYFSDGLSANFSQMESVKSALNGVPSVEFINESKIVAGEHRFITTIPLKNENEEIIGVIIGLSEEDEFRAVLASTYTEFNGYTFIVDNSGNIIVGSTERTVDKYNIYNTLENSEIEKPYSLSLVQAEIKNNIHGSIKFSIGSESKYCVYEPIGVNGWMLVGLISDSVSNTEYSEVVHLGSVMISISCAVSAVIFSMYVILYYRRNKELMHENELMHAAKEEYIILTEHIGAMVVRYNIKNRVAFFYEKACRELGVAPTVNNPEKTLVDNKTILYESINDYIAFFESIHSGIAEGSNVIRMKNISGETNWYKADYGLVYDTQNNPTSAVITLSNITSQREKELIYNRYLRSFRRTKSDRLAMIEYNLSRNVIELCDLSALYERRENIGSQSLNELNEHLAKVLIYPEDVKAFIGTMNRESLIAMYYNNEYEVSLEYRIRDKNKNYIWVRQSVEMAEYPDCSDIMAFISIVNINEEKTDFLTLKDKSHTDSLTDVYNRSGFINKFNDIAKNSSNVDIHCVIMLDFDNFKQINDTYGHVYGDKVLVSVSNAIKKTLRKDDIIGRIGGDEFIICLKNIKSAINAAKRAQSLVQNVRRQLPDNHNFSVSLGIAMFPQDGVDFAELYDKADKALYKTKTAGKNSYRFYNEAYNDINPNEKTESVDFADSKSNPKEAFANAKEETKQAIKPENPWASLSDAIVFDWDFAKNKFYSSTAINKYKIASTDPVLLMNELSACDCIHPDDIAEFMFYYLYNFEQTQGKNECSVRLKLNAGGYEAVKIIGIVQRDPDGKLTRTAGIIIAE